MDLWANQKGAADLSGGSLGACRHIQQLGLKAVQRCLCITRHLHASQPCPFDVKDTTPMRQVDLEESVLHAENMRALQGSG